MVYIYIWNGIHTETLPRHLVITLKCVTLIDMPLIVQFTLFKIDLLDVCATLNDMILK